MSRTNNTFVFKIYLFLYYIIYILQAALLGAGASVIGLGSDLAGSIRIPSLFCGIFGHKPTAGTIVCDNELLYIMKFILNNCTVFNVIYLIKFIL